jgi:LysR family transcriptional regulator (chromosome initiation inhibitor)
MLQFNRKDGLQHQFMALLTNAGPQPPTCLAPSTPSFYGANARGVGWGMQPEQFARDKLASGELVELKPGLWLDVPLYWHRWRIRSASLDTLSAAVLAAAERHLRQA